MKTMLAFLSFFISKLPKTLIFFQTIYIIYGWHNFQYHPDKDMLVLRNLYTGIVRNFEGMHEENIITSILFGRFKAE